MSSESTVKTQFACARALGLHKDKLVSDWAEVVSPADGGTRQAAVEMQTISLKRCKEAPARR